MVDIPKNLEIKFSELMNNPGHWFVVKRETAILIQDMCALSGLIIQTHPGSDNDGEKTLIRLLEESQLETLMKTISTNIYGPV